MLGAFYYYNPEPCTKGCSAVNKGECKPTATVNEGLRPPASGCRKTYEETLMDVYEYSIKVGLPYRHVQIDSWYVNISFLSPSASILVCVVGILLRETLADTCSG